MAKEFSPNAPVADIVFYRTYSRNKADGARESFEEALRRSVVEGVAEIGKLDSDVAEFLLNQAKAQHAFPSGRAMWVAGTEWSRQKKNFPGLYNCNSLDVKSINDFGIAFNLLMQGCGVGTVLETRNLDSLPPIRRRVHVEVLDNVGTIPQGKRNEATVASNLGDVFEVVVGDSREAWVEAYMLLIKLATEETLTDVTGDDVYVTMDLAHVRPAGEPISGFGGTANPAGLPTLFRRSGEILSGAYGRRMIAEEVTLLFDEAALCTVAGNVRRSACIRQYSKDDEAAAVMKQGLWKQDEQGNWSIDPKRSALRMSNHTRVYHKKPSYEEILDAVTKQFYSGEGAIQYAPEAIARCNADLLNTPKLKRQFIEAYEEGLGSMFLADVMDYDGNNASFTKELNHRMNRYGGNPCFAAGTMVVTRQGHFPIESLVGKTVDVWDGERWVEVDNFRPTGTDQAVYNVTLQSGEVITATAYHTFVLHDGTRKQLRDLRIGDSLAFTQASPVVGEAVNGAYLKGFLLGDGTHDKANGRVMLKLYGEKVNLADRLEESYDELPLVTGHGFYLTDCDYVGGLVAHNDELLPYVTTYRRQFPVEIYNWDLESKAKFIAGYLDADGTAMDSSNGFGYQVCSISEDFLRGFHKLLQSIGITGTFRLVKEAGTSDFGPERGGVYATKPLYRITFNQQAAIALSELCEFSRLKSFAGRITPYQVRHRGRDVVDVSFSHVADVVYCCTVPTNNLFTLSSNTMTGNCFEIQGSDFFCNLAEVHLNTLDPDDYEAQEKAFNAAAIMAASLLHHQFDEPKLQYSRELDPIIGVSFTGLFDFFAKAFGAGWLQWNAEGRPDSAQGEIFRESEQWYLTQWREYVAKAVTKYCQQHGLKMPNRYTTVQPAGTKSLLTNASPGWHPPKALRYIRRVTFRREDPVALAALDYGYSVVPSQSCTDENGKLLDDPFDPRVTEWLVEVPVAIEWAEEAEKAGFDPNQMSATAQFDLYMQVQNHYSTHTTSATIEFRENEIEPLAQSIYAAIENPDDGYISAALLARFDANETFPRLPFEPISAEKYQELSEAVLSRRKSDDFHALLNYHLKTHESDNVDRGESFCESGVCEAKEFNLDKPNIHSGEEGNLFAAVL